MIIESGHDLRHLLFHDGPDDWGVRIAAFDRNLRLLLAETVVETSDGSVADRVDRVLDALPEGGDVRFLAAGYRVTDTSAHEDFCDLLDEHARFRAALADHGIEFLGLQVSDRKRWATTGPEQGFRLYGREDYPRAVVIPGPHTRDCGCLACVRGGPVEARFD